MALDRFGNVVGTGDGESIAKAMLTIAGDPKAEAEAANFRAVSEANKIRLDDARRAAERDKALDPHRDGLASLFKPTVSLDPAGGDEVGPDGLRPKQITRRPAFHWNGNRFEFDQDAVSKLIEHGVALHGPDFAKNWHAFLTKAAPRYEGIDPTYQGEATINGLSGIPGGQSMSPTQVDNLEKETIAKSIANAKATASTGVVENPDGTKDFGENHPSQIMKRSRLPKVTDDEKGRQVYAQLPEGAEYVDPSGKIKIKKKKP